MSIEVIRKQLGFKERSVEDLVRFVTMRTGSCPNYTILMGAGCSVTSGVRSAGELIDTWRKEIYLRLSKADAENYSSSQAKTYLTQSESSWYSPHREYSSLFEKKFDLPRQRRMFVENEVAGKAPSLGYAYLVKLVQLGYINTIFTTNFDDLLNEAFYQFSDLRPIVCAQDSSIASVTVSSTRPKIIKLHGDYLFDDIKSTLRETESLEENTKRKFIEFAGDFGLIVTGYSGCDRSVMDVLHHLLKQEDYFKHGVYWCLRKDDIPSEDVVKLLWKDRVYFVEIDGYDELLASIFRGAAGDALPIDTSVVSEKPRAIIKRFCESKFLSNSSSSIIVDDLARLGSELKREALFESMRSIAGKNDEQSSDFWDGLSDEEVIRVFAIQQLISAREYVQAVSRCDSEISSTDHVDFKIELLKLRYRIEVEREDDEEARRITRRLLEIDPNNIAFKLQLARVETSQKARLSLVDEAITLDPYSYAARNLKAAYLRAELNNGLRSDSTELSKEIQEQYLSSLKHGPYVSNSAWNSLAEFICESDLPKSEKKEKLDSIVSKLREIDPMATTYFRVSTTRISEWKEDRDGPLGDQLLHDLKQARRLQPRQLLRTFDMLYIDTLKDLNRASLLLSELGSLDEDDRYRRDYKYWQKRGRIEMRVFGRLPSAIRMLERSWDIKQESSNGVLLARYLCHAGRISDAQDIVDSISGTMDRRERHEARSYIWDAQREYGKSLASLRNVKEFEPIEGYFSTEEAHLLIKLERYKDAVELSKKCLQAVGYRSAFDALIINHELATLRSGDKPNLARLGKIAETDKKSHARMCAKLLLNKLQDAKEDLERAIEVDKEDIYVFRQWAIFDNPQYRTWLNTELRRIGPELEIHKQEKALLAG